jgi:hypothetical protein
MQRAERNRKRAEREQKESRKKQKQKEADGDEYIYCTAKHLEVPWLSYRLDLFVNGRFHRVQGGLMGQGFFHLKERERERERREKREERREKREERRERERERKGKREKGTVKISKYKLCSQVPVLFTRTCSCLTRSSSVCNCTTCAAQCALRCSLIVHRSSACRVISCVVVSYSVLVSDKCFAWGEKSKGASVSCISKLH